MFHWADGAVFEDDFVASKQISAGVEGRRSSSRPSIQAVEGFPTSPRAIYPLNPSTLKPCALASLVAVAGYRGISHLASSSLSSSSSSASLMVRSEFDLDSIPLHQDVCKMTVFLSSTFTDSKIERRILIDQILPRLQDKGRKYGILTSIFDIRNGYCNGIIDDNSRSHKTWESSRTEIERCFESCSSPFLLTIVGDKYGPQLIPRVIPRSDLDARCESWSKSVKFKTLPALKQIWYGLDENYLPSPCYVLRSFGEDGNMKHFLSDVLPKLRDGLVGLALEEHRPDVVVGASVIEWEARYFMAKEREEAANSSSSCKSRRRKSYWVCRKFDELPDDDTDPLYHFVDPVFEDARGDKIRKPSDDNNNESQNETKCHRCDFEFDDERKYKIKGALYCTKCFSEGSLVNGFKKFLRDELKSEIEDEEEPNKKDAVTISCEGIWDLGISLKNLPNGDVEHEFGYLPAFSNGQLYMDEWEETVQHRLDEELNTLIEDLRLWKSAKLNGFGVSGKDMNELLLHHNYAKFKNKNFFARADLIENCLNLIDVIGSDNSRGVDCQGCSISLRIAGSTGFGTSSLMSKLYFTLQSQSYSSKTPPVIVRFCGTSVMSSDNLSLIRGICLEIMLHYRLLDSEPPFPDKCYRETVKFFHSLLSRCPIILLVSNLDQLKNENGIKKRKRGISFLKGASLHSRSRIIVSCPPLYAVDAFKDVNISRVDVGPIDASNNIGELKSILDGILSAKHKRRVNEEQMNFLLAHMKPLGSSLSVLYISLSTEVISTWRSFDRAPNLTLPSSCKGIIHQIFESLCKKFGSNFVRGAIGYITFSLDGVTDNEMQDLLTMTEAVMSNLKPVPLCLFFDTRPYRFPFHMWISLLSSLRNMTTERSNCCWKWNHAVIQEAAVEFFSPNERKQIHRVLGLYFGDLAKNYKGYTGKVSKQPFCYSFNSFEDVVMHRANPTKIDLSGTKTMGIWDVSASVNFRRSFEAAHHLIEAGLIDEAVAELCSLDSVCACSRANLLHLSIRYLAELIIRDTKNNQRINDYHCWLRKDFDLINADPIKNIALTVYKQPLGSFLRSDLKQLLAEKYEKASLITNDSLDSDTWIFQPQRLGGPIENNHGSLLPYRGSEGDVIPNGHDPTSSNYYSSFGFSSPTPSKDSTSFCSFISHPISLSFDGKFVASASDSADYSVAIWDAELLSCSKVLLGHTGPVVSIAFMRDNNTVISGSQDTDLKTWDIATGLCLQTFKGHCKAVLHIHLSDASPTSAHIDVNLSKGCEGSSFFYSGSADRTVRFWNANSGICVKVWRQEWDVSCISISIDGLHIASGSMDNTVRVLNTSSMSCVKSLGGHSDAIYSVCISLDKSTLVSGSSDKTIMIWDFDSFECIHVLRGHCSPVSALSKISPAPATNNKRSHENYAKEIVWSDSSIKSWSTCLCLTNDGSAIIVGTDENTVEVWGIRKGKRLLRFPAGAHCHPVSSICISEDGLTAVSSSSLDSELLIWSKYIAKFSYAPSSSKIVAGAAESSPSSNFYFDNRDNLLGDFFGN